MIVTIGECWTCIYKKKRPLGFFFFLFFKKNPKPSSSICWFFVYREKEIRSVVWDFLVMFDLLFCGVFLITLGCTAIYKLYLSEL